MYLDCCVRDQAEEYRGLALDTIFYIDGDPTYVIPRKVVTPGKTYLVYTLAGEGEIRYDGKVYEVHKQQLLQMRPQEGFSYRCAGSQWQFWWYEYRGQISFPVDKVVDAPCSDLITQMMAQSLMMAKLSGWDAAAALLLALCELLRHGMAAGDRALRWETFAADVEGWIRAHMAGATVAGLSEAFGMNQRTFHNRCQQATGLSPKMLIHRLRLELCAHLLLHTDMTLEMIAQQAGFSSPYHLSNCFKKHYGISPYQYRSYIERPED